MPKTMLWPAACLLLMMSMSAGWGQGRATPAGRAAGEARPDASPDLTRPLAALVSGTKRIEEARIEVQWHFPEGGGRSASIYGSGVGIYQGEKPFTLTKNQVLELLKAFQKARFGGMPDHYGEANIPPGSERPLRIAGSIALTIGVMRKEVVQIAEGEQSPTFAGLAQTVLKTSEEAARNSLPIRSFAEGLTQLAQRRLPPESLHILVHRLVDPQDGNDPNAEGFLLRLDGRIAETRTHTKARGYGEPIRLELKPEQMEAIVKLLQDNGETDLPINLYALHYTDFVVQILKYEKNVQARQFDGMTPQTHGENQKHFDRIFPEMVKLHHLVLKEGKPAPPPQ